jgi:putative spermidine/putrescine transport system ATP-binding protein
LIEMRGLTRRFGAVTAVDDLTLKVMEGELLAVLGPSGCGKSTLLRLIGGYERPDAGGISIAGRDVTGLPPEARNIGMVFQDYALFPHMTAAANVEFGLKMRGIGKEARRARALEALAFTGLDGIGDRSPGSLSGGQQQRLALARAIAPNPRLLLLDEPLSNLDARIRNGMRVELRAMQRRLGVTTILVTHDQEEALLVADRIAVMERGRLHQCAPPLEICLRPATDFVAQFLGLAP